MPVLAFWEEAVNRALPPESYEGFGCLATIDRLDPERWLDLTLRTARLCRTGLALPEHVANRAAGHAPDPRALQLVAALLQARLQLWHIYAIGRTGVELLRTVNGVAPEVRSELRERLVEREFFEARDL